MKIYFKSLTPIHIGNGEELSTLDYIIHDHIYYRVSQDHFLQFITGYPGMIERYTEWIDRIVLRIEDLERKKGHAQDRYQKKDYDQPLADIRAKMNVLEFAREVKIADKLISFLNNSDKVLRITIRVEPKPQIRGLVAAPGNRYYIPGTTLKGAIRTALLHAFLESEPNPDKITGILHRSLDRCHTERIEILAKGKKFSPDKCIKTFADELEHHAFYCSFINEKGVQIDDDEKYDIFKFLSISDCPLANPGLTLANIDLYLLSKQRSPRGNGFELIAGRQKQAPCVEAIDTSQLFEAEMDINLEYILTLKQNLRDGAVKSGREQQWIGLAEKLKSIFSLDIHSLTKDNMEETRTRVIRYILDQVNNFSSLQVKHDMLWLREFQSKAKGVAINTAQIIKGFEPLNKPGKNLMHLGYATGFHGTTEFLYLLSKPALKEILKDYMEFFEIGKNKKPSYGRDRRPYVANPDKFPKSRRLATVDDNISPLGWLEFSLNPFPVMEDVEKKKINIDPFAAPDKPEKPKDLNVPVFRKFETLKDGDLVDGFVTGQEGLFVTVKLCCTEGAEINGKLRYPAGFPQNSLLELKISFPNRKNRLDFNLKFIKNKSQ